MRKIEFEPWSGLCGGVIKRALQDIEMMHPSAGDALEFFRSGDYVVYAKAAGIMVDSVMGYLVDVLYRRHGL